MEGPRAVNLNGMTEMEWLEREQEKEMIELALERSLNDLKSQPSSQPTVPLLSAMPAIHERYDNHYIGEGRRNTMSSQVTDHYQQHHRPQHLFNSHRPLNDRDRLPHPGHANFNNRQDPYRENVYDRTGWGVDGPRENPMRNLAGSNIAPLPGSHRPRAHVGYPPSGSFRDSQEVTETVIDNPHHTYDRMGVGPSTPVFHPSRSRSPATGAPHPRYSYPSAPASAPIPPYIGRPPPAIDFARNSVPEYQNRPMMNTGRDHPNLDIPLYEARKAVLATARQHLSEEAVGLVEQALNLAASPHPKVAGHYSSSRQHVATETQHSGGSSSTFGSQPSASHKPRYDSRLDASPLQNTRRSISSAQEAAGLLRRSSAAEHMSQEELNELQRALALQENHATARSRDDQFQRSSHSSPSSRHHFQHSPHDRPQQHHQHHSLSPSGQRNVHPDFHMHRRQLPVPVPIQERQHDSSHSDPTSPPHHQQQYQLDSRGQQLEPRRLQQPRYRPNPRYAETGLRRSYSGDSLALAKEEIQKAVAANTLSKEEYSQLMQALEGESNHSRRGDDAESVRSISPTASGTSTCNTLGRARQRNVLPRYSKGLPPKSASYDGVSNRPCISDRSKRLPKRSSSHGSASKGSLSNSEHSKELPTRNSSCGANTNDDISHIVRGLPGRSSLCDATTRDSSSNNNNGVRPQMQSSSYNSTSRLGPENTNDGIPPPRRCSSYDSASFVRPGNSNRPKGLPKRSTSYDSATPGSVTKNGHPSCYGECDLSTSAKERPSLASIKELPRRSVSLDSHRDRHTQGNNQCRRDITEEIDEGPAGQRSLLPIIQLGGSSFPNHCSSNPTVESSQQNAVIIRSADPDLQGEVHNATIALPVRRTAGSHDAENNVNSVDQIGQVEGRVTVQSEDGHGEDQRWIPTHDPVEVMSFDQTAGYASDSAPVPAGKQHHACHIGESATATQNGRLRQPLVDSDLGEQQLRPRDLPNVEASDKVETAPRTKADEVDGNRVNQRTGNVVSESVAEPEDTVFQQLDQSFSSSLAPKMTRNAELPPRNSGADLRIVGSSHHSRRSKRSNKLSAAGSSHGAPGSVSVDLEYSVSQFGDSVDTFGSDMLGHQKGEESVSSKVSSDTDNSRQHQQQLALSPPSLSSKGTVLGAVLIPPRLGGLQGEEDKGLDVCIDPEMVPKMGHSIHSEGKEQFSSVESDVQNDQTTTEEFGTAVTTEPSIAEEGVNVAQTIGGKKSGMTDGSLAMASENISLSRGASTAEEAPHALLALPIAQAVEEYLSADCAVVTDLVAIHPLPTMDDRVSQQYTETLHSNVDPGEPDVLPLVAESTDVTAARGTPRCDEVAFDRNRDPYRPRQHTEHHYNNQWTEPHGRNRSQLGTESPSRQNYQEPLNYNIQHDNGWRQVPGRFYDDRVRNHNDDYHDEHHPQHQWEVQHNREPNVFDFHHRDWRQGQPPIRVRDGRNSEHDFVPHRQHQPSSKDGPSDSEQFDRHCRQPRHFGRRDGIEVVPDVPQQVEVEPRNRRELWASHCRQNSVSSLGESTQYSLFSAHFRQEEYERFRNEDYERAQYERDNWRLSHLTPLPHSQRENPRPYYESNLSDVQRTGPVRRQQQLPVPRDHDVPRGGNDYTDGREGQPDSISEHDRFDQDLKRALFESMQMLRESLPHGDDGFDQDLPPNEARLTREQLDLINRALSGSEPRDVGELVDSDFNRFGSVHDAPNQFDAGAARFREGPTGAEDAGDRRETMNSDAFALEIAMQKAEEERQSLLLALQLQEEEERRASAGSLRHSVSSSDQRARRILPTGSQMPEVPFSTMQESRPNGGVISTSPHPVLHARVDEHAARSQRGASHLGVMHSSSPGRPPADSFSSQVHGTTSSQIGAIRSSSPNRIRHPLEDSYSSLQQSRTGLEGVVQSSSLERARPRLDYSYTSQMQGMGASQVGAVRSSGPDRIHPLDESTPSESQGRSSQSAAGLSTSPMTERHILDEASSPVWTLRGHEQAGRRTLTFDESANSPSSRASLVASRTSQPRSYEEAHSSEGTPDHNQDLHLHANTPTPQDRTLPLSAVPVGPATSMSLLEVGQRPSELIDSAPLSPHETQANLGNLTTSSPPGGTKGRQTRRDTKVLGSVARLGKKSVTSLMQTMKFGSSRKLGAGTNPQSVTTVVNSGAPNVDIDTRHQIELAISKGFIYKLNGVVKLGKEATIYHAEKGSESNGFDVAVKIYKRAKGCVADLGEESQRDLSQFQNISSQEQLELWTTKEFRNLKKAKRFGVPSPAPLFTKDNILFMQFMGLNGRPAPQLGELEHRRGHKRWKTLYKQIVEAVRRLYVFAMLVHGNLNESNILVVPRYMIDTSVSVGSKEYEADTAVLIDFGQTVDSKHPDADELLRCDLQNVRQFFARQGIRTPSLEDTVQFVTIGTMTPSEFINESSA